MSGSLDAGLARPASGARAPDARGWAAAGAGLALLASAAALSAAGLDRAGFVLGLRLTARLAFVAFWPCYTAGALVVLFGPKFLPLKRRAPALGLGFAAVLGVHLGLLTALCAIGATPAARVFIVFTPGVVCAAALVAASARRIGVWIGPAGWWLLRNVAMNVIMADFAIDFFRREPLGSPRGLVQYLPFAVLAAAAPALRLIAAIRLRLR